MIMLLATKISWKRTEPNVVMLTGTLALLQKMDIELIQEQGEKQFLQMVIPSWKLMLKIRMVNYRKKRGI